MHTAERVVDQHAGAKVLVVCAIRRGDNAAALTHMEHAQRLNPGHQPTAEQVARLREALGAKF